MYLFPSSFKFNLRFGYDFKLHWFFFVFSCWIRAYFRRKMMIMMWFFYLCVNTLFSTEAPSFWFQGKLKSLRVLLLFVFSFFTLLQMRNFCFQFIKYYNIFVLSEFSFWRRENRKRGVQNGVIRENTSRKVCSLWPSFCTHLAHTPTLRLTYSKV